MVIVMAILVRRTVAVVIHVVRRQQGATRSRSHHGATGPAFGRRHCPSMIAKCLEAAEAAPTTAADTAVAVARMADRTGRHGVRRGR